jgi:hypothetical protein
VGAAAAPPAAVPDPPDPPAEPLVVPAAPVARAPVPVPVPEPVREPEGVVLEALDVPTDALPPETVTDGALAETVGVAMVGVLVLTVGRGAGAFAVTVGVWTVTVGVVIGTVGVLIGTVGVAIGTVGVCAVTVGAVTPTVGVANAMVGVFTGAVVSSGRVNEAAVETSPAIATTAASTSVNMTVFARLDEPPALITANLQHSAIRVYDGYPHVPGLFTRSENALGRHGGARGGGYGSSRCGPR